LIQTGESAAQPGSGLDDVTAGYIHMSPSLVQTTNGCTQFEVYVMASVTDAGVFSLKLYFDSNNLALIGVAPSPDTTLHLMPAVLIHDTLCLDGFFEPDRTGPNIHLATITAHAISPDDAVTLIGFVAGEGYGGAGSAIDTIAFGGDSTTIFVEGTAPRPPEDLIIRSAPPPAKADSVLLYWRAVTRDMDGDPVVNPLYKVYVVNVAVDSVFEVAATLDTFCWDDVIRTGFHLITYDSLGLPVDTLNHGIYFIQSCKTQP